MTCTGSTTVHTTFHFLSGEEYKAVIEKREEVRKAFHSRMIETAKVITVQLYVFYYP